MTEKQIEELYLKTNKYLTAQKLVEQEGNCAEPIDLDCSICPNRKLCEDDRGTYKNIANAAKEYIKEHQINYESSECQECKICGCNRPGIIPEKKVVDK